MGKLHQLIDAYQGAELTEASYMTLGEWLDQWLEKYAATMVPKCSQKPKKILTNEQMDIFMKAIEADEPWYDFFYTELTTGLRHSEICGLQWQDFGEEKGTLKIARTLHYQREGEYSTGETKTGKGKRTIILPKSTADLLRKRKQNALSEWIFHHPVKPEHPTSPHYAYMHLKALLNKAGLPDIRFHDLRHTFATTALENGMDVKTLSAIIGHTSAATTLDIYTHITDTMQKEAAASIDRGIGNATEAESSIETTQQKPTEEFEPVKSNRRKPGTGCVTQINDHLWEGRYSPKWIDGKKRARNVYAHTREECEEKLVC